MDKRDGAVTAAAVVVDDDDDRADSTSLACAISAAQHRRHRADSEFQHIVLQDTQRCLDISEDTVRFRGRGQERREPSRGPGTHSRGAALGRKFLNFFLLTKCILVHFIFFWATAAPQTSRCQTPVGWQLVFLSHARFCRTCRHPLRFSYSAEYATCTTDARKYASNARNAADVGAKTQG